MPVEPVTAEPPRAVRTAVATVRMRDVCFVHWAVPPSVVRHLLPAGTQPDLFDGAAYVSLVTLRAHAGLLTVPPVPYVGSFPQTNVRTYTVDAAGRRGVAFLSLDVARLLPRLLAGAGGLPYRWSRMHVHRRGDVWTYVCARRFSDVTSRLVVRVGEPMPVPGPLALFLTARWGLHAVVGGRLRYVVAEHEPWPLYEASPVDLDDGLVPAGLGGIAMGMPRTLLWSPGVDTRFGAA
jgi:uncharacterized protein YqjF (DUF2071 family)